MRHKWGALTLLAAVLWAGPPTARAQTQEAEDPAVADARQRFELAERQFQRGDYASALTEWQRVYQLLDGHPRREYVMFNIARANEELARTREAIQAFEQFLAQTPEDAPNRADAQQRLHELRLRAQLSQDAEPVGESPAPDSPAPASGGGFSPSPVGIVIGAAGLASMIAGGIVGAVALVQDGKARGSCDSTHCTEAAYNSLVNAHTLANVADGLLWGGLGVAVVGAVLAFLLGDEERDTTASASCSPYGCSAVLRGRF